MTSSPRSTGQSPRNGESQSLTTAATLAATRGAISSVNSFLSSGVAIGSGSLLTSPPTFSTKNFRNRFSEIRSRVAACMSRRTTAPSKIPPALSAFFFPLPFATPHPLADFDPPPPQHREAPHEKVPAVLPVPEGDVPPPPPLRPVRQSEHLTPTFSESRSGPRRSGRRSRPALGCTRPPPRSARRRTRWATQGPAPRASSGRPWGF